MKVIDSRGKSLGLDDDGASQWIRKIYQWECTTVIMYTEKTSSSNGGSIIQQSSVSSISLIVIL